MAAIGEEEDRQRQLTDLPDDILIRILSLLPIKSAVRTCLLLLRRSGQHHLWKSITSLEFHQDFMLISRRNFVNFVDRVMNLRDRSIHLLSFSLQTEMEHEDDANRIETWITKAVQCNVEELTLSVVDYGADITMANTPYCCVFRCRSLVKLELDHITFNVPSSVICLPSLKYLRLSEVRLEDDESTEKLLSSPLLEELIIENCYFRIISICVCSPKLQILKICDQVEESEVIFLGNCAKICIIGDNLKHFSYKGNVINEYQICASSTQLNNVEIYVNEEMPGGYALNFCNILKGLSRTRNLALSDYFLQGLQKFPELLDTIPVFECLTQLDIQVNEEVIGICIDSLALMKLYERCLHLEYLNIGKLNHIVRSQQLSPVPLCFQTHLKKIVVHYYVPGDEDDTSLGVFLNSAFVLEELVIYCRRDEEKGFHEGGRKIQELQDRLNRRPRVSKDCKISVRVTYCIASSSWAMWEIE